MQDKGNKLLASGDFLGAIQEYSAAIDSIARSDDRALSNTLSILYSNRSVAYVSVHQYENALEDANRYN